jgi:hypothetical protein
MNITVYEHQIHGLSQGTEICGRGRYIFSDFPQYAFKVIVSVSKQGSFLAKLGIIEFSIL